MSEGAWTSTPGPGPRPFSVSVREARGAIVVELVGEIDLASADEVRGVLLGALDREPALVVADLSAVDVLDSTGLGALIAAATAERTRAAFAILAPGGLQIRGVLSVTGVLEELTVFESKAEIESFLAARRRRT